MAAGLSNDVVGQLDLAARRAVPFVVSLALILLGMLPWSLPGAATIAPLPLLAAVFYWTGHRPELMPPPMIFILGLLQDLLGGGPPGLTSLLLLLTRRAIDERARQIARSPFLVEWAGFAVVAAGFEVANWLSRSIYYATVLPLDPLVFHYLCGLCLYPLLYGVLGAIRVLALRLA
jgi:rod shape-determining protein MreD